MSARTGSLPHYLQANCLSPEQMKVWWAKQTLMEVVVKYFEKEGWKIEVNIPKIEAVMSSGYGEGPIVIDLFDLVQTIHNAMQTSGYRIVKDVETGEANRPNFDARSYEVGYIEGQNSVLAEADTTEKQ